MWAELELRQNNLSPPAASGSPTEISPDKGHRSDGKFFTDAWIEIHKNSNFPITTFLPTAFSSSSPCVNAVKWVEPQNRPLVNLFWLLFEKYERAGEVRALCCESPAFECCFSSAGDEKRRRHLVLLVVQALMGLLKGNRKSWSLFFDSVINHWAPAQHQHPLSKECRWLAAITPP